MLVTQELKMLKDIFQIIEKKKENKMSKRSNRLFFKDAKKFSLNQFKRSTRKYRKFKRQSEILKKRNMIEREVA